MTGTIHTPSYVHREVEFDLPIVDNESNMALRIAKASLPFLGLYQPFAKGLTIASSLTRAGTTIFNPHFQHQSKAKTVLNVALAAAAIAGTVFSHPVGILITSIHDMGLNIYCISILVRHGDAWGAAKHTAHLANNTLYLFSMIYLSVELQIASLAVQVLVGSISSIDEFKQGNWIEGFSHMLMAGVRIHQMVPHVQTLKRKWEIEAAIKRVFVGELHEKWRFPSDHLPVGAEVEDCKIISWNVLNNAYMEWVTDKDSQGLNGSIISELNVPIQSDGLTARDQLVVNMVKSMTTGSDFVALQECGEPFLAKLESSLPQNWKMVRSFGKPVEDQDVILFDASRFTHNTARSEVSFDGYTSVPGRPIQNAVFQRMDQPNRMLRIFNAHIPGNPLLPARDEFASYVHRSSDLTDLIVALGDNNFERHEMMDAYLKAGFTDFTLHSPWQTNIDPYTKESKCIDHIFVKGASGSRALKPYEILGNDSSLHGTIDLLNTPATIIPPQEGRINDLIASISSWFKSVKQDIFKTAETALI